MKNFAERWVCSHVLLPGITDAIFYGEKSRIRYLFSATFFFRVLFLKGTCVFYFAGRQGPTRISCLDLDAYAGSPVVLNRQDSRFPSKSVP